MPRNQGIDMVVSNCDCLGERVCVALLWQHQTCWPSNHPSMGQSTYLAVRLSLPAVPPRLPPCHKQPSNVISCLIFMYSLTPLL